jgi:hypothetical protein
MKPGRFPQVMEVDDLRSPPLQSEVEVEIVSQDFQILGRAGENGRICQSQPTKFGDPDRLTALYVPLVKDGTRAPNRAHSFVLVFSSAPSDCSPR